MTDAKEQTNKTPKRNLGLDEMNRVVALAEVTKMMGEKCMHCASYKHKTEDCFRAKDTDLTCDKCGFSHPTYTLSATKCPQVGWDTYLNASKCPHYA